MPKLGERRLGVRPDASPRLPAEGKPAEPVDGPAVVNNSELMPHSPVTSLWLYDGYKQRLLGFWVRQGYVSIRETLKLSGPTQTMESDAN